MPEERVLRVRVPEEVYWALVRRAGSPKRLSATVTELLREALGLQAAEPLSHQSTKPSSQQASKPLSRSGAAPEGGRDGEEVEEGEGPAPAPYRDGGGELGAGAARRGRSLGDLEDCAIITGVRRPEALLRRCAELGLRACELGEVGLEGAIVFTEPWAQFVLYLAEEEPERLPRGARALEERFAEAYARARAGGELGEEDKVAAALYALWREGELFWDGSRWRRPPKLETRQPAET
jgi:hypothetical protein